MECENISSSSRCKWILTIKRSRKHRTIICVACSNLLMNSRERMRRVKEKLVRVAVWSREVINLAESSSVGDAGVRILKTKSVIISPVSVSKMEYFTQNTGLCAAPVVAVVARSVAPGGISEHYRIFRRGNYAAATALKEEPNLVRSIDITILYILVENTRKSGIRLNRRGGTLTILRAHSPGNAGNARRGHDFDL